MGQQWERSLFCQFQLLGSYWKVHWLKLAPGLKKVQWGKLTPPNIFFRPILPNFEKKLKSETMILGGGPCSQSVRREAQLRKHQRDREEIIPYKWYALHIQPPNIYHGIWNLFEFDSSVHFFAFVWSILSFCYYVGAPVYYALICHTKALLDSHCIDTN